MLKQTKEYSEFAEFIEDSGGQVKSVNTNSNNLKVTREMLDLESD
jgi:2-C-methyl-D-erythritol 4-phosphate cytidylyltransferase